MDFERYTDAAAFYSVVRPFLMQREAAHNLLLSITRWLSHNPDPVRDKATFMVAVREEGRVTGAALYTPSRNLLLSEGFSPSTLAPLVRALSDAYDSLPGVLGPEPGSSTFAEHWQAVSGQRFHLAVEQRIYQLVQVMPVESVGGSMRKAAQQDRVQLIEWVMAFNTYAYGEANRGRVVDRVERWLQGHGCGIVLWEDPQPVSMAIYDGPTSNGIRISIVYTPPECRRRGYASALVASLSQMLLNEGYDFCFLFTNLNDPTPNKIYMQIGYEPVCDVHEYEFLPRE